MTTLEKPDKCPRSVTFTIASAQPEHKELSDQFKGLYVEDGNEYVHADPSKLRLG